MRSRIVLLTVLGSTLLVGCSKGDAADTDASPATPSSSNARSSKSAMAGQAKNGLTLTDAGKNVEARFGSKAK